MEQSTTRGILAYSWNPNRSVRAVKGPSGSPAIRAVSGGTTRADPESSRRSTMLMRARSEPRTETAVRRPAVNRSTGPTARAYSTKNPIMAILEIENLEAGYGNFLVLTDVSMSVDDGQVVCVIGPNGAGKSTVFRCVYGLIQPSAGSIRFRDEDITGLSQHDLLDRKMAYVLQRDSVFKDMTIRENLEMGAFAAPRGFDMEARVEEMYEMFPILEERRAKKARTLSGGQRQMLEFARGLMLEPEMLLLDEPTAGLAPKVIDRVFEKVQEINERGVTILMIEQNIKTGLRYSDFAYVLENGETKFEGPADTILDRPEIREAYLTADAA